MSFASTTFIAFSMSADAFAAAISKGMTLHNPRLRYAAKLALLFGFMEAIAPLLGWVLGALASGFIAAVDHWIAFGILSIIGGRMIYQGCCAKEIISQPSHKLSVVLLTAAGTSVDAMAVGASLALLEVNIWLMAGAMGLASFFMALLGIMLGHHLGKKAGKIAEILGGIGLMVIGCAILMNHLVGGGMPPI